MDGKRLVFRVHALKRMAERRVSESEVRHVLEKGEIIQDYPEDLPFPSRLVAGWHGDRPLHVVVAENPTEGTRIVVTVYEPDPEKWQPGFRERKQP